jgi:hypothetical protein
MHLVDLGVNVSIDKTHIWCIFSIENEYNQPMNNLYGWFPYKPSIVDLANVFGVNFENAKDEDIVNIVQLFRGEEVRIDNTDFRLEQVTEGLIGSN